MARGIRITVSSDMDRWIRGLADLDKLTPETEAVWQQAVDIFFGRTQEAVHILSGDLKRSGRSSVRRDGKSLVGEVEYGGGDVDYAIYEIARGGAHDFITGAWNRTQAMFQAELERALEVQINTRLG